MVHSSQSFGTIPTKKRSNLNRRNLASHTIHFGNSTGDSDVEESAERQHQHAQLDGHFPNPVMETQSGMVVGSPEGSSDGSSQLQGDQIAGSIGRQFITSTSVSNRAGEVQVPHDSVGYDSEQVVEAGWRSMLHLDVDVDHIPLISDKQALAQLANEYHFSSTSIVGKIENLCSSYGGLRRSRGDGNCFYRSFLFGYLESIAESGDDIEADRMLAVLTVWDARLRDKDYLHDRFEGGVIWLSDFLEGIVNHEPVSELMEDLEVKMRNWVTSMQAIQFVRFICADEILEEEEHYSPFIFGLTDGTLDVLSFCQRHVAMMGEESDHIQLVALTNALKVPVRVLYLDGQAAAPAGPNSPRDGCATHEFKPAEYDSETCTSPWVNVLYRPGHYDVLYPL